MQHQRQHRRGSGLAQQRGGIGHGPAAAVAGAALAAPAPFRSRNPFTARDIASADESIRVIRFANPKGIDFPYLLNMINSARTSRTNTVVVPGDKMELALQLIFTPFIWRMMERRKRALGALCCATATAAC